MFVYTATEITSDGAINVTVHTTQDGALTRAAAKAIENGSEMDWGREGRPVTFAEYVHDRTGGSVDNPIDVLEVWHGPLDESGSGPIRGASVLAFGDGDNSLTIERTEVLA